MVRCYSVSPGKPTIIKLIPSVTSLFSQSLGRSPPLGRYKVSSGPYNEHEINFDPGLLVVNVWVYDILLQLARGICVD